MDYLMSPNIVAQRLGVRVEKARQLMRQMKCVQIGGIDQPRWAVPESELQAWIESHSTVREEQRYTNREVRQSASRSELFEPDGRIKRRR